MANPDRARGFKPVYHVGGGSWNNGLAVLALPDAAAAQSESDGYFIGSPVFLAAEQNSVEGILAGLPVVLHGDDENDEYGTDAMYGVVVGIGHPGASNALDGQFGMFDPNDLTHLGRHLSEAEAEADLDGFVLYIAPALGWVFEVQVEAASDNLTVGEGFNLDNASTESAVELGNVTTGQSTIEVVEAAETNQFVMVGYPDRVDNDIELANAKIYVQSIIAFGSQGGIGADGGTGTE